MPRELLHRLDAFARVTAALVGTLPPALLASGALAAHVPLPGDILFAIGFFSFVPLWVTAMTFAFLVRRGWLAWTVCVATTAGLAIATPGAAFWPSLP